jgi:hypothetical protein
MTRICGVTSPPLNVLMEWGLVKHKNFTFYSYWIITRSLKKTLPIKIHIFLDMFYVQK